MLIDCDTCTVRGAGCDDCVVTVVLGAPPPRRTGQPTVVPLLDRPGRGEVLDPEGRPARDLPAREGAPAATGLGTIPDPGGVVRQSCRAGVAGGAPAEHARRRGAVVEFDAVEGRAVQALAQFGLVPPLRHQQAWDATPGGGTSGKRRVG